MLMRIIVINPKNHYTKTQVSNLNAKGETIFVKGIPNYSEKIFTDNEEKVIVLGPEQVDWKFSNDDIDKIQSLKAVFLPTTGYGWLDGRYLRSKDIALTNVPKYSTESVAEYAISLMFNVAKKLPLVMKNKWVANYDDDIHRGWEVKGKTMGIIGLGSIGSRIAELGQQIGMNVVYWSRKSRDERFEHVDLDVLLSTSDFIFPALVRNVDTKKILTNEKLNKIKKSSFIVSITGDDLFDMGHVVSMVKSGKLAGLALESEKNKMKDYEGNVWITPSIAWLTVEAFAEDMKIWIETAISFIDGKPANVVN